MAYMPQTVQIAQRPRGMGEYDPISVPWSWMFYPPPYDFADPDPIQPPPTFIAPARYMDMGGLGDCGCGCGGSCGGCGGHAHGMGLFDSGWDISGWGWQEWGLVAVGAYVVFSTLSTTSRGVSSARRGYRKSRSRSRRRAELRRELEAA